MLPSSPYLPKAPPPAFGIEQLDPTQQAGFQALCLEVFTATGIEAESVGRQIVTLVRVRVRVRTLVPWFPVFSPVAAFDAEFVLFVQCRSDS